VEDGDVTLSFAKLFKVLLYCIGSLALFVAVATLLLLIGSTWHLSDDLLMQLLQEYNVIHFLHHKFGIHWLPDLPNIVVKDQLNTLDAVVNGFTLFVTLTTLPIFFVLLAVVAGIYMLFHGLFTADWGELLQVFFLIIGMLIGAVLFVIAPIIAWFAMFFQPITPGFFVVWLFMGLPLTLLGVLFGVFRIECFSEFQN